MNSDIIAATGLYDAFNVSELADISSLWNETEYPTGMALDTQIRDTTTSDGWRVINAGAALSDYEGKRNTAKIVAHAKKIIGNYFGKTWPTTMTELADVMQALIQENSTATYSSNYDGFCFPAAWGCTVYEPQNLKGELSDYYKSGRWYLYGLGELCRIYSFIRLGCIADEANFEAESEALTPIFANAASKAGKTIVDTDIYRNRGLMSSTESSQNLMWCINFTQAYATSAHHLGGRKESSSSIRPCCSVIFKLDA